MSKEAWGSLTEEEITTVLEEELGIYPRKIELPLGVSERLCKLGIHTDKEIVAIITQYIDMIEHRVDEIFY